MTNTALPAMAGDSDEALAMRLRDLALVDIDALTSIASSSDAQALVAEFADDVAEALRQAKLRIVELRQGLLGAEPLQMVELPPRQRASEAAQAGIDRIRTRLVQQADAARALAKISELAAGLVAKLAEADRRR